MITKPVYQSTQPQEAGPFTARNRRSTQRRNPYRYTPEEVLPSTFDIRQHVQATAVAAIRKAFTQSKTSHAAWKTTQREGRFDTRSMMRAVRSEQDVFKRKTGRSTTKVRCAVLIDASGSMGGRDASIPNPNAPTDKSRNIMVSRSLGATVFAGTIAEALGTVPTVDLEVWQHAAGGSWVAGRPSRQLSMKWRWKKGTPLGVFNEQAAGIGDPMGGGNADGHALHAITQRLSRQLRRGEHGVIMVVSDGLPSVYSDNGSGEAGQALIDAVAEARRLGITVLGVAIDGSDQSTYYGDGLLRWTGDWGAMGKSLATTLGKALAKR